MYRLSPPRFSGLQNRLDQWKQRVLWKQFFLGVDAYDARYSDENREDAMVDMVPFRSKLPAMTCYEELPQVRAELESAVETLELSALEAIRIFRTNPKKYPNVSNLVKYS